MSATRADRIWISRIQLRPRSRDKGMEEQRDEPAARAIA
jgi:hypothetical protein